MADISFVSATQLLPVSFGIYPIFIPIYTWVLNSAHEPLAYDKKLIVSLSQLRSIPSAILLGIDNPDLVI